MNTKNKFKTILTLAIVTMAAFVGMANAATVTTSTTAPTVDGADVANLVAQTGTLKWFHDIEHNAGQTFTPGESAKLNAFTIQLGASNQNLDEGNESVLVRLGTITRPGGVFTFTDIYSETANLNGDWLANDYVTFTFKTPQILTGGDEYGIITDAQSMGSWQNGGIPYLGETGDTYADGHSIGRGGQRNNDLVFHADMGDLDPNFPSVYAGKDVIAWSQAEVSTDPCIVEAVDSDWTELTYEWTTDAPVGYTVEFIPSDTVEAPTVKITKDVPAGGDGKTVITMKLEVNDAGRTEPGVTNTMKIDLYDDACLAKAATVEVMTYEPTDINTDCMTNLVDFAMIAKDWLSTYAIATSQPKPVN